MKHQLTGKVVSDKMQKTVVVMTESLKEHPKYHKRYRVSKKYKAHDENNECKIGDVVLIEECRPLSADCLLYTSPSPRDRTRSRMPSSACKKKIKTTIRRVLTTIIIYEYNIERI